MSTAIGIDLGTTFSAVGFFDGSKITIVQNDAGKEITPSVVHFSQPVIVGVEALKKRSSHPKHTISQIKRFIGREHNDRHLRERDWPFEVVKDNRGKACVRVDTDIYTPEEVSSIILKEMKKIARKYMHDIPADAVIDAVITVPSNFTNVQRQATEDAGKIAGLNVLQIINEPTAAALAFCHKYPSEQKRKILVFDLGGGTFDVSIVESDGIHTKVLSTDGITDLGGVDFDMRIYEEAVTEFIDQGHDARDGDWALIDACETAKKALARKPEAGIDYRTAKGKQVSYNLTHDTFVEICDDLIDKTMQLVQKALEGAGLDKKDLDEIVLVGGSTRISHIRKLLSNYFSGKKIRTDIDPDTAIAQGAALMAASLTGVSQPRTTGEMQPATGGTLSATGESLMATGETPRAAEESLMATPKPETPKPETPKPETPKPETTKPETPKPETTKPETPKPETPKPETPKPNVAVAIHLVDVTPHSLGLRVDGDKTNIMIPKNTSLPFEISEIYTNAEDFEKHLSFEIVEGEKMKASENVELAKFRIAVTPKKRNGNSIRVFFKINTSGILEVTAVDTDTGKKVSITVQSGNLRDEERNRMARQMARMMDTVSLNN